MAQHKLEEGKVTVTRERGSDIQVTYVKRSAVREYFEKELGFPLGDDFDAALDEVQGVVDPKTEGVVILVIQDDEA